MKIGILQCGRIPDALIGSHDDYNDMCAKLLGYEHFEFAHWPVLDNIFPDSHSSADGWLITGSKFGAYEEHEWIAPLESLIRNIYKTHVPLAGICFGHQIIAQALGGTVEKFSGGWSAGHVYYNVDACEQDIGIHAFHQDQITKLPPEAEVFGSTDFCQFAFIRYKKAAISMQPHPEFDDAYMRDLLRTRGKVLPPDIEQTAREFLGRPLSTQYVADMLRDFFLNHRKSS